MIIRYKITNSKELLYLNNITHYNFYSEELNRSKVTSIFFENDEYYGCCVMSCDECKNICSMRIDNYISVKHIMREEKLERILQ